MFHLLDFSLSCFIFLQPVFKYVQEQAMSFKHWHIFISSKAPELTPFIYALQLNSLNYIYWLASVFVTKKLFKAGNECSFVSSFQKHSCWSSYVWSEVHLCFLFQVIILLGAWLLSRCKFFYCEVNRIESSSKLYRLTCTYNVFYREDNRIQFKSNGRVSIPRAQNQTVSLTLDSDCARSMTLSVRESWTFHLPNQFPVNISGVLKVQTNLNHGSSSRRHHQVTVFGESRINLLWMWTRVKITAMISLTACSSLVYRKSANYFIHKTCFQ